MAKILYRANARADLIPGHVVGLQYSFDIKLRDYSQQLDQPATQHVSLSGRVETVLIRAVMMHRCTLLWPDSLNAQMDEFLLSVAGGESFEFDPYGTIASPDNPFNVISTTRTVDIARYSWGETPWRQINMTLRVDQA